jgi:hypothetical protein
MRGVREREANFFSNLFEKLRRKSRGKTGKIGSREMLFIAECRTTQDFQRQFCKFVKNLKS